MSGQPDAVSYPSYVRSDEGRERWDLCAAEATHRVGPMHSRDPRYWLMHVLELFVDPEAWPNEALVAARAERDAGATPRARLDVAFARYRRIPFPACDALDQHSKNARGDLALLEAEFGAWVSSILKGHRPNRAVVDEYAQDFASVAEIDSPIIRDYCAETSILLASIAEVAESEQPLR